MNQREMKENFPHYATVFLCGLLIIVSLLLGSTTISVYIAIITDDLGISRVAFSTFLLIKNLLAFCTNLILPRLLRRFRLKPLVMSGLLLMAAMFLIFSVSRSLLYICAAGVIGGVAYALTSNVPVSIIISNWFYKSRGTALGIVTAFSGICGVFFNPVMSLAVHHYGWRTGFCGIAVLCVLAAGITAVFLKVSPLEAGLRPYGEGRESCPTQSAGPAWRETSGGAAHKVEILLLLAAVNFLFAVGPLVIYGNMTCVLEEIGFSLLFATGTAASVASLANCSGKFLMGVVNDRINTKAMLLFWFGLSMVSASYFTIFRGQSAFPALTGVFLVGLTGAIFSVPAPIVAAKLFSNPADYTDAVGISAAAASLGGALSNLIFHGIYSAAGSYIPALQYTFVLSVVCFLLVLRLVAKNRNALR